MSGHLKVILGSCRLPFLILPPIYVSLAAISVYYSFNVWDTVSFVVILVGAISALMSVNLFNEYLDFKSGLDLVTKRTPFSGGSGAIPSQPESLFAVKYAAITTFVVTCLAGFYLIFKGFSESDQFNISLLVIGFLGCLLILVYTGPINNRPWLCLISPGSGLGLFLVFGISSVLLQRLEVSLLPTALLLFILANNLLLLNQLPDLEADKSIGRNHLWIYKGIPFTRTIYLLMTLSIPLLFIVAIVCKIWPLLSLLSLLPWGLTLFAWKGIKEFGLSIGEHPQFLAMNVIATLIVPLSLAIILLISAQ